MALILLLFVLVPLAELAVVVAAADSFGLGVTLLALLAFSVSGAWLMRREGIAVWRRANDELAAGRPPARELLDGAMILAGGALLLTPGFITDFVGLMMLLPPVRAAVRPFALRAMARRANSVLVGAATGSARANGRSDPRGHGSTRRGFRTVIIDAEVFGEGANSTGGPGGSGRGSSSPGTAEVINVEPGDGAGPDSADSDGAGSDDDGRGQLRPGN